MTSGGREVDVGGEGHNYDYVVPIPFEVTFDTMSTSGSLACINIYRTCKLVEGVPTDIAANLIIE